MNLAIPAVALLLVLCPAAPARQESPRPIAAEEVRSYAEREARSPATADFEAGDAVGGLISLLIIVALVCLIWWILTGGRR